MEYDELGCLKMLLSSETFSDWLSSANFVALFDGYHSPVLVYGCNTMSNI